MDATTFFCERLENEVREDSEKTRVEINALLAENQRVLEEKLRVQIDAELMKVVGDCEKAEIDNGKEKGKGKGIGKAKANKQKHVVGAPVDKYGIPIGGFFNQHIPANNHATRYGQTELGKFDTQAEPADTDINDGRSPSVSSSASWLSKVSSLVLTPAETVISELTTPSTGTANINRPSTLRPRS